MLSVQAKKIQDRLLSAHTESPFLDEKEIAALNAFKASESWASKFARKSGWRSIALHGEAGSVDIKSVQPAITKLRDKIKEYDPDHVYNMDETGLFFKVLPNRSYVKKSEIKSARGTKLMKAKDRVTLYITTNGDGTDKVPLSMIGKAASPRCFNNRKLPMKYYNQNKAWSDSKVFAKWWDDFRHHIQRRTIKPVLLILDNCGPHGTELVDPTGQITVVFLPPNVTSVYQPMDAGVIAMVKKNYRYRLLRRMLDTFEERQSLRAAATAAKMKAGTIGLDEGHAPHLRDVMSILDEVWNEIPASKISNCWKKTTILSSTPTTSTAADLNSTAEAAGDATVTLTDDEAHQLYNLIAQFSAENVNDSDLPNHGFINDFDQAFLEMATAVEECDADDEEEMRRFIDGWVSMEDNEYCQEVLADEVKKLMDVDLICALKDSQPEEDDDDDEEEVIEIREPTPPSFEKLNDIAGLLKSLSIEVDDMGEEYGKTAVMLNDASNALRADYRRMENRRLARMRHSVRQTSIWAFMKPTLVEMRGPDVQAEVEGSEETSDTM